MDRQDPRHADDCGAAAVEFAMVSFLLFLFLFGIVQVGILFAQDLALSNAVQRGARAAAVPTNDCAEIEAQVRDSASTLLPSVADADLTVRVFLAANMAMGDLCAGDSSTRPCERDDILVPRTEVLIQSAHEANLQVPLVPGEVTLQAEGRAVCEFA